MRSGELQTGDFSESVAQYHQYVQWLAQEQMDALLKRCTAKNVSFYLDMPLGVNPDGYDVWRERDVFAKNINAGAPPDIFFTRGQDWGFAPLHPRRMREQHYKYFLEMLRFQMRHTNTLRIDHVMGLRRLYWIPRGAAASEGAYVRYPGEELYAILSLESHRHNCVIVGENLGTVPSEVNKAMLNHHLRQMYVLQYELTPNPKKALGGVPSRAVASLNTHDMPTFAAFFKGDDIRDRFQLGLVKKQNLKGELAARKKLTDALIKFLEKRGKQNIKNESRSAMEAALGYLAASDVEILLVNLEDLWLETRPQNVPGTSHERANWRHKAKFSIEELQTMKELNEALKQLTKVRSGR
jgi:4-alpha-glucanotransferase